MESKKGIAMITQKQIRAWIPPALETFRKYYPLPEDPPYHIINEYPDNPRSIMFTTPENEIFIVRSQVDYSKSSPGKYRQLFNHHYWHELGHVVSKINSPKMSAIFWSEYLGAEITPSDVGIMMALMKIARISSGHYKEDNYVDVVNYLLFAAELNEAAASENV